VRFAATCLQCNAHAKPPGARFHRVDMEIVGAFGGLSGEARGVEILNVVVGVVQDVEDLTGEREPADLIAQQKIARERGVGFDQAVFGQRRRTQQPERQRCDQFIRDQRRNAAGEHVLDRVRNAAGARRIDQARVGGGGGKIDVDAVDRPPREQELATEALRCGRALRFARVPDIDELGVEMQPERGGRRTEWAGVPADAELRTRRRRQQIHWIGGKTGLG